MKSWKVLALALVMGLCMGSLALAHEGGEGHGDNPHHDKDKDHDGQKDKKEKKSRYGKVVSVSGTSITIETGPKDNKTQEVIETNADTKISVNGKEGKLADIKEGMWINAKPADGVATHVKAFDKSNKDGKKPKDKDKEKDHAANPGAGHHAK